jgi:hypothetical protein
VEKAKPATSGSPAARRLAGGSAREVAWGRGARGGGRLAGSHAGATGGRHRGGNPNGTGTHVARAGSPAHAAEGRRGEAPPRREQILRRVRSRCDAACLRAGPLVGGGAQNI